MPDETPADNVLLTPGLDLSCSIKTCRGKGVCPYGLVETGPIKKSIERALTDSGWDRHLRRLHPKGIRPHHRLRIAVAACPNGCSQPHIHDIGLIAALRPNDIASACTGCGLCGETCREDAIFVRGGCAVTRAEACLACGECAGACPVHAIQCAPLGFRLLLGGHMGRHPAWATELRGIYPPDHITRVIHSLVSLLIRDALEGERPSQTFARLGFERIDDHIGKQAP